MNLHYDYTKPQLNKFVIQQTPSTIFAKQTNRGKSYDPFKEYKFKRNVKSIQKKYSPKQKLEVRVDMPLLMNYTYTTPQNIQYTSNYFTNHKISNFSTNQQQIFQKKHKMFNIPKINVKNLNSTLVKDDKSKSV